ncbi:uroporphyrinogen-III C-methyltransferase [Alkalicoccobacillus murimartini]|uniref:uroporphyrinogen-III C-methyltransferase n=1 Tax=Alkalicoccobacillus murimartini TaxID=171685 RepID=A0ABT9YH52_9BACI|nr:uroporphyrinogen-III C-methyltransferase [Alkalicoccobacillus murimartini]MDQ0207198.1 uroporphyrinogen III methyltransferase/synthase [Alkalicoccobacillus murimartini]
MNQGCVYFVGAGPGDLELITVKGLRLLQKADVIVFDRLVNPFLLTETNKKAKLIYCGKQPCKHTLRQEDIQKELLIHAKKGLKVVRLKGGDPSIFGRVGEEAELCARHQINYEVIPGITSGSAASIYSGVPLTHRHLSGSFATVTGHTCTKDGKPAVNWEALAKSVDTIVFYMGIKHLRTISEELTEHGMSKDTPILIVQWGTYSKQRSVEGTLSTIANQATLMGIENPAIIIVGNVIQMRSKLNWFENKPLSGRGILIPTNDASDEMDQLKGQGADICQYPFLNQSSIIKRDQVVLTRLFEDKHINTILLKSVQDCLEFFEYIDLSGITKDQLNDFTWICNGLETSLSLAAHGVEANQTINDVLTVQSVVEALLPQVGQVIQQ